MAAASRVGWLDSGATRRRGLIANRSPTALSFLRAAIFQESSKCFGSHFPATSAAATAAFNARKGLTRRVRHAPLFDALLDGSAIRIAGARYLDRRSDPVGFSVGRRPTAGYSRRRRAVGPSPRLSLRHTNEKSGANAIAAIGHQRGVAKSAIVAM